MMMITEWPKFGITVVEAPPQFGILIDRFDGPGKRKRRYFYPAGAEGLAPTETIITICEGESGYSRVSGRTGPRILEDLREYTKGRLESGKPIVPVPTLAERYPSGGGKKRGYAGPVGDFFRKKDAKSEFMKLIGTYEDFQARVLDKLRDKDEFEGKAEWFRICPPDKVIPPTNLELLKHVTQILKLPSDPGQESEWFRDGGPIAADIERHKIVPQWRIYDERKTEVPFDELKKRLLTQPISLLQGGPASGKTTLIRYLAYQLYDNGHASDWIYFCRFHPRMNVDKLAQNINSLTGIIFVEDIHLDPLAVQALYEGLSRDEYRHILLIARPLDACFMVGILATLGSLHLNPFDAADKIISCYTQSARLSAIRQRDQEQLKKVSEDDYLLLGDALAGYKESEGKGPSIGWIKKSVEHRLSRLEFSDPFHSASYPLALVAISALYQNEVLMAAEYLSDDLRIDIGTLNALVLRGDVRRVRDSDGHTLYGLSHSSRAKAYWEHGNPYKNSLKVRKYEDFLYDYATSGASNALEAVLRTEYQVRGRLLERIQKSGKMEDVIQAEQCLSVITDWIHVSQPNIPPDSKLMKMLLDIIERSDDPSSSANCIMAIYKYNREQGKTLVRLLNLERIQQKISQSKSIGDWYRLLSSFSFVDESRASELCSRLDLENIASQLSQSNSLLPLGNWFMTLSRVDIRRGRKLLAFIGLRSLAPTLSQTTDFRIAAQFIFFVNLHDKSTAHRLCAMLDLNALAARMNQSADVNDIGKFFETIHKANTQIGKKLYALLDLNLLAQRLVQADWLLDAVQCLRTFEEVDPTLAQHLCSLIDLEALALRLDRSGDMSDVTYYFSVIRTLDPLRGSKLLRMLNLHKLAQGFLQSSLLSEIRECLVELKETDESFGRQLCALFDVKTLAERLNGEEAFSTMELCLEAILSIDTSVFQKTVEYLCLETIMRRMRDEDYANGHSLLDHLFELSPRTAHKFSSLLDLPEMAYVMATQGRYSDATRWFASLRKVDRARSRQLIQAVIDGGLPNTLGSKHDPLTTIRFVKDIAGIDSSFARELCDSRLSRMLTAQLRQSKNLNAVLSSLIWLFDSEREIGLHLIRCVGIEVFARNISAQPEFDQWRQLAGKLMADKPIGTELCNLLDLRRLVDKLNRTENVEIVAEWFGRIHNLDKSRAKEFLDLVDSVRLAHKLSASASFAGAIECLGGFHSADDQFAHQLCTKLDLNILAKRFSQSVDVLRVCLYLSAVYNVNKDMGHKLAGLLDNRHLANRLLEVSRFNDLHECIQALCETERAIAKNVFAHLSVDRLADRLDRSIGDSHRSLFHTPGLHEWKRSLSDETRQLLVELPVEAASELVLLIFQVDRKLANNLLRRIRNQTVKQHALQEIRSIKEGSGM